MKITLSPANRLGTLSLSRNGDVLTINGKVYDFSALPDGATLPRDAVDCAMLASDVERIDGELHLALTLPYRPGASEAVRFPAPIIDPPNGPVELPQ